MSDIKKACELIKNSKKTFALTGAGISTDSGILDFRSEGGYYSKLDPMTALSKDVLLLNPKRFYNEGYLILEDLNDKVPNDGHIALAEMEELKFLDGVITQNIDNLHEKAGSKNIYEVHGETRGVHCMSCGREYEFNIMQKKVLNSEIPPLCDSCHGVLRPNVVMFGDMMPRDFEDAIRELEDTELLIVVGSSLTVSPVNYMPRYVDKLIIINLDPTPFDEVADFVFHDSASKVLSEMVEELKSV